MNVRPLGLDGGSIRELTDAEIADLVGGVSGSKGELFHYSWHNGPRSSIDAGCAALDGQVIQYAINPVVCQAVWDGKQNAVLEENWAANKNCWSRGDGATWVRVPNLNMADGSAKPFYLRGGPDGLNGTSVGDAIRNITGETPGAIGNNGAKMFVDVSSIVGSGATRLSIGQTTQIVTSVATSLDRAINGTSFDASRVVPTADENRVKTAYGVWVVRVFTEVSNTGAIDAAALATQLGVVDAAVQKLDAQVGFAIIYPNGGTEAAPANVSINSRYVMANPFPGHHVICEAELLIAGKWGATGFTYSSGGMFTQAFEYGANAENIVVQTGGSALMSSSIHSGNPHASSGNLTTPTPCRVKVWKLKGGVA